MIISWYGEGCFKLQNGDTTLITDVPDASSGCTAPRGKVDVYIKTLTSLPPQGKYEGAQTSIYGAGEYDTQGIRIKGFQLLEESSEKFFKTVYIIKWDDIVIGTLGHISGALQLAITEQFEEIDVLIAPAGDAPFIHQKELIRLVKSLNPKIYIPSFYKIAGLKRKAEDIREVSEALNGGKITPEEKYVFKKKDLEGIKKTNMIVLNI